VNPALLAAGLAAFVIGALIDVLAGVGRRWARVVPYLFGTLGCGLLAALGARSMVSAPIAIDASWALGAGTSTLSLDPLAGIFLALLFGLGVAVCLCALAWARADGGHHRGVASGFMLLLASVAVIVAASDAFVFLFAWELLTLSFYILTSATRSTTHQPSAAWATVGTGKVSGAALLFGFLLLAGRTGSLAFASWHGVGPGALHDAAWTLVVVGFGAKVGLVPFEVWIPVGYPAAPGPIRAGLAGIAANVGIYGLWRFFGILGAPPEWLVVAVLLVGGVTALLGIAFAAVQSRLTRVVAYSSIENAGLIVTAYGVALAGAAVGSVQLVAIGLLAATLQTVAHAMAKSTLFVAVATIEAAAGTDELSALRGIGRQLRWSGGAFAIAAVTLAGLPPTIGFVSEWFVLEALMQQFRLHHLALQLGLAGAGALVALTTGLAALTFIRLLGLVILGPRPPGIHPSEETSSPGRIGLVLLALGCLVPAAASPWEFRFIARGLGPLVPRSVVLQSLKQPWVLQPVFRGFSILSPSWLWIALPVAVIGVTLGAIACSGGRYFRVRRVPSWHSATVGVAGPSSTTPFGFANLLRHVLGNVLGVSRTVRVIDPDAARPLPPGSAAVETRTRVVEPVETYLYRPARWVGLRSAGTAKRLQSGNLAAYVAYMLIALMAVLAVTAFLH
jgi:hydrogenase-4 component B